MWLKVIGPLRNYEISPCVEKGCSGKTTKGCFQAVPKNDTGWGQAHHRISHDKESMGWAGQEGLRTEAGVELGLLCPPEQTPPGHTTEGPGTKVSLQAQKDYVWGPSDICSQVFEKWLERHKAVYFSFWLLIKKKKKKPHVFINTNQQSDKLTKEKSLFHMTNFLSLARLQNEQRRVNCGSPINLLALPGPLLIVRPFHLWPVWKLQASNFP